MQRRRAFRYNSAPDPGLEPGTGLAGFPLQSLTRQGLGVRRNKFNPLMRQLPAHVGHSKMELLFMRPLDIGLYRIP